MRKYPFATHSCLSLCAVAILIWMYIAVSALAARQSPKVLGRKAYRSPDHTLVATVVSLQQLAAYGGPPSRVEIRNAGGRLLSSRDHSYDAGQGFIVRKAVWTPDSRFLVYNVYNSGGHSPWHHPIFVYSRKRNRFYSLDRVLEAIGHGDGTITGGIELRKPSTLLTKARYTAKSRKGLRTSGAPEDVASSGGQGLAIDLRWLEPRLTRSVENYDR